MLTWPSSVIFLIEVGWHRFVIVLVRAFVLEVSLIYFKQRFGFCHGNTDLWEAGNDPPNDLSWYWGVMVDSIIILKVGTSYSDEHLSCMIGSRCYMCRDLPRIFDLGCSSCRRAWIYTWSEHSIYFRHVATVLSRLFIYIFCFKEIRCPSLKTWPKSHQGIF